MDGFKKLENYYKHSLHYDMLEMCCTPVVTYNTTDRRLNECIVNSVLC